MKLTSRSLVLLLIGTILDSKVRIAYGQARDFEPPIAIDSIFANDSYVLGSRGTIYHLWQHGNVLERYPLGALPVDEKPVDLLAAANHSISVRGGSSLLVVVANPSDLDLENLAMFTPTIFSTKMRCLQNGKSPVYAAELMFWQVQGVLVPMSQHRATISYTRLI